MERLVYKDMTSHEGSPALVYKRTLIVTFNHTCTFILLKKISLQYIVYFYILKAQQLQVWSL